MGLQLPPKTRLGDEKNACGSFGIFWESRCLFYVAINVAMASMWARRPLGGYIVQLLTHLSLSHRYLLRRLHGEMVAIKRLYFNKPK
jgi:hypothetical protein